MIVFAVGASPVSKETEGFMKEALEKMDILLETIQIKIAKKILLEEHWLEIQRILIIMLSY